MGGLNGYSDVSSANRFRHILYGLKNSPAAGNEGACYFLRYWWILQLDRINSPIFTRIPPAAIISLTWHHVRTQ